MKILGLVGSMRKEGNTNRIVQAIFDGAKQVDGSVETETLQLSELKIGPCRACYDVCANEPYLCVHKDDLQVALEKMKEADAIVLGSALYFNVPSRLLALIERLSCVAHLGQYKGHNEHPLADKPCCLVAVSYCTPPNAIFATLQQFTLEMRMRPVLLKSQPFYGVAGTDKMEKDEFLKPLESAKEMGRLLVQSCG
ncbi:MAG: flavodoxin family protein [Candidatus Coatesbacteria bacterium]|nr:flavodoxin family protein [Candidatus Coatesbacteria bacterium]